MHRMTDRKSLGGLALLALSFTGLALHGCSSGPLSPLAPLNPALRKQWSEDESYGLMFRQRMEGIDALAQQAPRMAPADAAQTAVQMTKLVQSDPNPLIRRAAVGALGNFPAPVGDAGLAAAMNDEVTTVRVAACRAWGQRQDATALQSLARALENDEDADVN